MAASVREKIALLFVIIGYFYNRGDAASFEFEGGTGSACIIVNMDATFNISRVYDFNQTEIAEQFTLEGANVTATQSKCGAGAVNAILTLSLFPSTELLKLKFVTVVGSQEVLMSVVLNVQPKKHFNETLLIPFEMEDDGDLSIGQRNNSFTCASQQMMTFGQDPGYFMTMKITNMQIQGYDVVNSQFSPAVECSQDNFTTTAPSETTTEPMQPTTEPEPVNGTTEETLSTLEPETTSTVTPATLEPETTPTVTPATVVPETTVSPEPSVPKFDVGNGTVKCIVLEGEMEFQISYTTQNSEISTASFVIPLNATATGSCAVDGADTTQEIILSFFEGWSFTVQIAKPDTPLLRRQSLFRDNLLAEESTYAWKKMSLAYVVNEERFPDAADSGPMTATKEEDTGIFQGNTQGSYKCIAGESVDVDESVKLDVTKLQYRAFGETDDDTFPNEGVEECSADKNNDDDDDDSNTTAIVLGSVFGGLAFIILVVVIAVAIRRRKSADYEVM